MTRNYSQQLGRVGKGRGEPALRRAEEVLEDRTPELMRYPNVTGLGIEGPEGAGGDASLLVYVTHKLPLDVLDASSRIPHEIDGLRVRVEEVGNLAFE